MGVDNMSRKKMQSGTEDAGQYRDPTTFEEAVYAAAKDIANVVISKQKDYGHGNILKFGEQGLKVRMSDKMERIIHLMENAEDGEVQNESLLDSFTDMAKPRDVHSQVKRRSKCSSWWRTHQSLII